jgi:hypothetical protein
MWETERAADYYGGYHGQPSSGSASVGVQVSPKESGLPRPSVVHLGHLYTIDKGRLGRRVGRLPQPRLRQVDRAIQVSLGLRPFEISRASLGVYFLSLTFCEKKLSVPYPRTNLNTGTAFPG